MKNKKVILSVLAGIVIAGAIIAWLMLSGDKPITVKGKRMAKSCGSLQ